jgi:hypothetical protein
MYGSSKLAQSSVVVGAREDVCGPAIQTIPVVQTITKVIESGPTPVTNLDYITQESFITVPHSCFTYTILTPWAPGNIPPQFSIRILTEGPKAATANASVSGLHCGIHNDCETVSTTTIYAPPHNSCCRNTPTIQVASPSPTYTKVCRINTITEIVTLDSPSQQYLIKKATPTEPPFPLVAATSSVEAAPICTTVFRHMAEMQFGPTKTIHPNVYIESVILGCIGCTVVTKNIGGLGPVAIFTTTVTDEATSTSTSFVCRTASTA